MSGPQQDGERRIVVRNHDLAAVLLCERISLLWELLDDFCVFYATDRRAGLLVHLFAERCLPRPPGFEAERRRLHGFRMHVHSWDRHEGVIHPLAGRRTG